MPEFRTTSSDERVRFRIHGHDIQTVEMLMEPGARVILQPGAFLCGAGGVREIGVNWGRSLLAPVIRSWSGESAILQDLLCEDEPARVVLGAPQIGRIVHIPIRPGRPLIAQRGAFLAAVGEVDIGIAFTRRIRAGLFGGQGVVFQRLHGHGDVFLHALGGVVDWRLPEGRMLRVSTRNILAFEHTVGFDVQLSGGLISLMFSKQGMFLSQLEGPGRTLVQSVDHGAWLDRPAHSRAGKKKRAKRSAKIDE